MNHIINYHSKILIADSLAQFCSQSFDWLYCEESAETLMARIIIAHVFFAEVKRIRQVYVSREFCGFVCFSFTKVLL